MVGGRDGRLLRWIVVLIGVLGFAMETSGAVQLPNIFSDNMVLQHEKGSGSLAYVYGWASPGERVTVALPQSNYSTIADATTGKWKVTLGPLEPTANPFTFLVSGETGPPVTVANVTVGEVYLCSGQSNMEFPLNIATNGTYEMADAVNWPQFRLFRVSHNTAETEVRNVTGTWALNAPDVAGAFSALCYLTARDVQRLRNSSMPVGLVQVTWGGTRVEAWMSKEALAACPAAPAWGTGSSPQNQPTALWNGMAAPVIEMTYRMALWYQGETNAQGANSTDYYACMFQSMIADWRGRAGYGDLPFLYMQLPPSLLPTDPANITTGYSEIRQAQLLTLPHTRGPSDTTGMVVGLDLGGVSMWGPVHPPAKNVMGQRMAAQVLHVVYAEQEQWNGTLRFSGPVVTNVRRLSNGTLAVIFADWSAQGLYFNGTLNCTTCCPSPSFEVLSPDQKGAPSWQHVDATISGSTVLLATSGGSAVRYGWQDYVQCALYNVDALPASPFILNVSTTAKLSSSTAHHSWRKAGLTRTPTTSRPYATPLVRPPMGFNTWNAYRCNLDENIVRSMAQAMQQRGLQAAGYTYVNIDDCWQVARQANGTLVPDPVRFPSGMTALAEDLHAAGFGFGVYTARGTGTCQGRPGSLEHERIDAATFCDWDVDYVKIDVCEGAQDANASWTQFHTGFADCYAQKNHSIVMSVETCGDPNGCGTWVAGLANLWRTSPDLEATFASVLANAYANDAMAAVAKPGHYNDPDMLEVGNPGLDADEALSHFALWCVMSAPLLIGTDLIRASNNTLAILSAPELIAIDQDLGYNNEPQGRHVSAATPAGTNVSCWLKRLASGSSYALIVVNEGESAVSDVKIEFASLGLPNSQSVTVRDMWARKDVGTFDDNYTVDSLPRHGSASLLLKV